MWGGVYQSSARRGWDHPHYEKIAWSQAANMRVYALAYALWRDPQYLRAAQQTARYVAAFLTSPDGAFYASQDADAVRGQHSAGYFALSDVERRRRGVPAVDKNVYARENGWLISALVQLHAAGEPDALAAALRAARWVYDHRSLPRGGFMHGEADSGGPFLGDSLAMGRALLDLYAATADTAWLARAETTLDFIRHRFADPSPDVPGFYSAEPREGAALAPVRRLEENIALARFAILAHHYTGRQEFRRVAESALRWLASGDVALANVTEIGVVLAEEELRADPLHVTIVGAREDAAAAALHRAALALPAAYKRIDWLAPGATLPNLEIQFPELDRPAAFLCAGGRCSAPIFNPDQLSGVAARFR